jgi:hypothetical protein
VNIEQASLSARVRRSFRFLNRRRNSVNVQHARQRQPAKPGANNLDGEHPTIIGIHFMRVKVSQIGIAVWVTFGW